MAEVKILEKGDNCKLGDKHFALVDGNKMVHGLVVVQVHPPIDLMALQKRKQEIIAMYEAAIAEVDEGIAMYQQLYAAAVSGNENPKITIEAVKEGK